MLGLRWNGACGALRGASEGGGSWAQRRCEPAAAAASQGGAGLGVGTALGHGEVRATLVQAVLPPAGAAECCRRGWRRHCWLLPPTGDGAQPARSLPVPWPQ